MRQKNPRGVTEAVASKPLKAIYISSFLPRKCGIARFTRDLTIAIDKLKTTAPAEIMAMSDDNYVYPAEVGSTIRQHKTTDYRVAMRYINQSDADVVNLQHEFGLYGGTNGDYILPLLEGITKPLVTNFHSVLPKPNDSQLTIMRRIIDASDKVVAMTERSKMLLESLYGCAPAKISIINHGVRPLPYEPTASYKKRLKTTAEPLILTLGLIGPGKGLEYAIEAMVPIARAFPNAKLIVAGQTHPGILKVGGEEYRKLLRDLVAKLSLQNNVVFINRYISETTKRLLYLAADIFMTPHIDPQQPMSGTLAYGLGAGKVCVSTPYYFAKEVLGDGTGVLVDFKCPISMAKGIIGAWSDPVKVAELRHKAYQKGQNMRYPHVARQYLAAYADAIAAYKTRSAYLKTADIPSVSHR